ncbi:unnamed protein product, partial [Polarella glacialis]
ERSSMLKSFTVYIVQVSDFGRQYQIERRFDDFAKLHSDLIAYDPSIPPLPEKRMFSSTDASVVAERRPAFQRILRHMLRSEDIVMEKSQTVWKFLEMPPPAVVATRYLFKSQRLNYARQCGKLTDPKYDKEHAYRLTHPMLVKTSLRLLATEGALQEAAKTSAAALATPEPAAEESSSPRTVMRSSVDGGAGYPSDASTPQRASSQGSGLADSPTSAIAKGGEAAAIQEAEASIVEMLRWAIANGTDQVRQHFLKENGIGVLLSFIFRKGRSESSREEGFGPDQRARNVLNALIKAAGDKFSSVFAHFLSAGGISVLSESVDLLQQHQGFADFVSKLLWIAWDEEAQRAFLSEGHIREALGLLSALFECPSKGAR